MTAEKLLNTLEDLNDEEFKKFKWFLKLPGNLEGYDAIKTFRLENAERQDTVDLMVNTYKLHGALEMTKTVLEKTGRNDLVQRLSDTSLGPEGQSHFFLSFVFLDGERRLTTQYL